MNRYYDRMKKLLLDVGIVFKDGGISKGEIIAYAKGIEILYNRIKKSLNKIYILGNENFDLSLYNNLLNIDSLTEPDNVDDVIRILSLNFGSNSKDDIQGGFSEVGEGDYSIDDDKIVFDNIGFDQLKELGNFISGYIPLCVKTEYNGTGLPFDDFDSLNFNFNKFDSMNLPFDIIDTLRSDIIE